MFKYFFSRLLFLIWPKYIFNNFYKNRLYILRYHQIGLSTMEKHLAYLRDNFDIISMNKALSHLRARESLNKKLVITFDDADICLNDVIPLFTKNKIPLTIFVSSGNIGSFYWWKAFESLRFKEDNTFEKLRSMGNKKRLDTLSNLFSVQDFNSKRDVMTFDEIKKWSKNKYVNFESHSVNHPFLHKCSDEESLYEISESKEYLENKFSINVNHFAYPNGDFDSRHKSILRENNYISSVLDWPPGVNTSETDPYKLHRIGIHKHDSVEILSMKLSGIFWKLKGVTFQT